MTRRTNIFTILLFCLTQTSCGQIKQPNSINETYKVLAKLISFEGGDKIHYAKFKVLKNLTDSLVINDTIFVAYYNYKQPEDNIDNVLLTIKKQEEQTSMNDYYICPDYDGKSNIEKAKIEYIEFDHWEGCETGKGDCKTLSFSRTEKDSNWFLIMPCGGTSTTILISGPNFNKTLKLYHADCPPCLDLSNLKDGKYAANMMACGLGGTVTFNLTTTK